MYMFLTGPFLWFSVIVFVFGLIWRSILYIKGLDTKLDRVAYHGPSWIRGFSGAITSIFQWLIPFGTHSLRKQIFFTIGFFLFHLGVIIVPIFFIGHIVMLQESLGFSLPSMPMWLADTLTVGAILGALMLALRRVALPEVRFITSLEDWFVLVLPLFVLVSGFFARLDIHGYDTWLLLHIFSAELVLILAPFTKLSHMVLYFMSRGQIGMDYAIKRGGAKRGAAFPW